MKHNTDVKTPKTNNNRGGSGDMDVLFIIINSLLTLVHY